MAGWGSGGGQLPVGNYVAQIRDVEKVTGKDFKDKSKIVQQFKWGVDYWDGQRWIGHTIYTGQNFADLSKIDNPQFIPKLCLLVRACGMPLPQSAQEAAAWSEESLLGKRFVISVQKDEMLGTVQTKYLPDRSGQQQAAPVTQTAPATIVAPSPAPSPAPTVEHGITMPPPMPAAASAVTAATDAWA